MWGTEKSCGLFFFLCGGGAKNSHSMENRQMTDHRAHDRYRYIDIDIYTHIHIYTHIY